MAGPNLELFKFGVYVFFPVAIMLHYGNPDWYQEHIVPYRDKFWPTDGSKAVPHNTQELNSEIESWRSKRLQELKDKRKSGLSPPEANPGDPSTQRLM